MKKSLVMAMAMALGVTASAYAANPFSDVPAGHWAYDSVNKLVASGVIEGYLPSLGDGFAYLEAVREALSDRDNLPDYRLPDALGFGPFDRNWKTPDSRKKE